MELDRNSLENVLFEYFDQIKILISPEIWENILLDCSKNEILILILLYRKGKANMTQISEYTNVPLNTATGIAARMEKKDLICRERSKEDQRVVTIVLSSNGMRLIEDILKQFILYGQEIIGSLTIQEIELVSGVLDKVIAILREDHIKENVTTKKVRKIIIE